MVTVVFSLPSPSLTVRLSSTVYTHRHTICIIVIKSSCFTGVLDNIWTRCVGYFERCSTILPYVWSEQLLSTKLYRITHSIWSDHLGDADRLKSWPYLWLWRCWSQDLIQTTWRHLWVQIWGWNHRTKGLDELCIVSTGYQARNSHIHNHIQSELSAEKS